MFAGLLLIVTLTGCGKSDEITIGSKNFTENMLISEMLAQLVETHTDISVKRALNMGGTFVCFEAIKNGNIDIYPEYTGTGLTAQLQMGVISDPDETYEIVKEEFDKQFNITWLDPFGFNNTFAIGISGKVYDTYHIETCSELASVAGNLLWGADHEFYDREDGYNGFIDTYGIIFKGEPVSLDNSLKYQAIGGGDIDATNVFATDGQIKQYDLKILVDDKNFFPPYYAAPIVRNETLEEYPELEEVLNMLEGKINDKTMTELNYAVDVELRSIEDVAKSFLRDNGLI